jgi:predicted ArsR family transcriptional regulator
MSATTGPRDGTRLPAGRRAVLYAVRRRGEATAEQVAEQLDITVSGARQQLAALAQDGLVESSELASPGGRRGRRTLVYAATEAADAYFPKAYGELTNELLGYVADADGELLDQLFARRRDARIAAARARLAPKRTLRGKVAELTRILDEDGYLASWEQVEPGVFRIVEHNCAIWAVARRYGQACTSEIEFIRTMLDGADVERVQHMVAGARRCAYEVRARGVKWQRGGYRRATELTGPDPEGGTAERDRHEHMADDADILHRIDALVDEEHALERAHGDGRSLTKEEKARLGALEVQLDQLWDLLRQRRARRAAGLDPDDAEARDPSTVEHYRQ